MNRETELHFSQVPTLKKPRSKMVIPNDYISSFSLGKCYPVFMDPDILPGDTVKMKLGSVIRMATPLYPIFGNIVADLLFFFVPYRLVWTHWREFWGENTNAWYNQTEYKVPEVIASHNDGFQAKSLADYMGLPTGVKNIKANNLPFRAYCKIWNDFYRSESLQQECPFSMDDQDRGTNNDQLVKETQRGGDLLYANKLMDLFTGCLPAPQKGPDVMMPLGAWAPVTPRTDEHTNSFSQLKWNVPNDLTTGIHGYGITSPVNGVAIGVGIQNATTGGTFTTAPNNLWTDLSLATSATINTIRTAISIQQFYEAQTNGSRYIEFIKNIFGVTSPDGRMQRSEYLGGKRIPINVSTVLKTSSTDETSPLGQTGAYSHTADADEYFTHSFVEHGCLMGILTLRYYHSYNQGIPKGFTRTKWTHYYNPFFANLGNEPVYNKEIYAQGTNADNDVFGYQEAWANGYRYHPNMVTGAMRTTYAQSMDAWHLADNYASLPHLGSEWIKEDPTNLDRALAVTSQIEDQFFGDFYFRPVYTRVMPLYSMPGLERI